MPTLEIVSACTPGSPRTNVYTTPAMFGTVMQMAREWSQGPPGEVRLVSHPHAFFLLQRPHVHVSTFLPQPIIVKGPLRYAALALCPNGTSPLPKLTREQFDTMPGKVNYRVCNPKDLPELTSLMHPAYWKAPALPIPTKLTDQVNCFTSGAS